MEFDYHEPVLLHPSVDMLNIRPDGVYVDVTFGGGGHSREILSRLGKKGRLIAFDQDAEALTNAPQDKRLILVHSNFRFLRGQVRAAGFDHVDGILADLGVSSHHFDTAERGFSFRFEGPLDMRMNRSARTTAAAVVNNYSTEELIRIFRTYGELEKSHRVAMAIEKYRTTVHPLKTIQDLLEAVQECTPKLGESKFLARLFQALRIEVNGEMQALRMMLEQAVRLLDPEGGRLSVITYHSLEDRMVKNIIRSGSVDGKTEKDFFGRTTAPLKAVGKAILPDAVETERNPRARSAKLRGAERIEQP